jgi:hypothetical protein
MSHRHDKNLRKHVLFPKVDYLEDRVLLYSAYGDQWTYDSRITYSFIPDGTSIGGVSSVLFSTLNAKFSTATWEQQIEQAASLWEGATNANLALVPDGGQAVGVSGDQQDDSRFGDIRIGAIPLGSGILGETFLPPAANGGTDAGDIILNSNVNWQINSNYDLMTVAAHEFGHALGLADSTVSGAVMYGTYTTVTQTLTSDDIAGIQSIYGARQYDQFNTGGHRDNIYQTAANINSYIGSNAQIAIPSLDNTTSSDDEWYYVTVPSTTTGTMAVSVQSSNLSSFAPKLQVYSSSLSLVGQVSAANTFGATVSFSTSVVAGQSYYFKVLAASTAGAVGGYGLLVNFGSQTQSPISPPNTVVASQPDRGGGMGQVTLGGLTGFGVVYSASDNRGQGGSGRQGQVIDSIRSHPHTNLPPNAALDTNIGETIATNWMASATVASAEGSTPLILQAIDEALASWPSKHHSTGQ